MPLTCADPTTATTVWGSPTGRYSPSPYPGVLLRWNPLWNHTPPHALARLFIGYVCRCSWHAWQQRKTKYKKVTATALQVVICSNVTVHTSWSHIWDLTTCDQKRDSGDVVATIGKVNEEPPEQLHAFPSDLPSSGIEQVCTQPVITQKVGKHLKQQPEGPENKARLNMKVTRSLNQRVL